MAHSTSQTEHSAGIAEEIAMRRALELAATPGFSLGPNPRVGCVLLSAEGEPIAESFHRGAGTPHAEVAALSSAGDAARGATAIVTLEPCNHTGRTGPCTGALIEAGVRRVVFAQSDPNPQATGGAQTLTEAGIDVTSGLLAEESRAVNPVWSRAMEMQRPVVTWKFATTLDGRSAAADGTSRWVSSPAARLDTHRLRARSDVMLVGTNTVAVDDPQLTVRGESNQPLPEQPLRVVMGERDLDPDRRVFDDSVAGGSLHLRTRDPQAALADLWQREKRHVFLEGGPTLAVAFLKAGLIDEVVAYVAPMLLGTGRHAVGDLGITTITDALHLPVTEVTVLEPTEAGDDTCVRITMGGTA